MFNAFLGRVYVALISLSTLVLSNYTGNSPRFTDIFIEIVDNGIYIRCFLEDAFENDFKEIFDSGILVSVTYELEIIAKNSLITQKSFTNTAIWEFENRHWLLYLGEDNIFTTIENFEELKQSLSFVETFLYFDTINFDSVNLNISARLPTIHFTTLQKSFDLMIFWKLREPKEKININLRGSK